MHFRLTMLLNKYSFHYTLALNISDLILILQANFKMYTSCNPVENSRLINNGENRRILQTK